MKQDVPCVRNSVVVAGKSIPRNSMKTGGMMVTTRMKINQILMMKTMQMKMISMRRSMATMKMIMILIKIMMTMKIHNNMTMMTMLQMMTTDDD